MSSAPTVDSRRQSMAIVGMAVTLWTVAFTFHFYGAHHILTVGGTFRLLASLSRAVAFVVTVGLAVHALVSRRWIRLAASVGVCVVGAASVMNLGLGRSEYWNAYNRGLVARHADLVSFAAAYDRGQVRDGSALPKSLRPLSRDGRAHVWGISGEPRVLFIQRWQDWRAESGDGIAYFPTPPAPGVEVVTASGDLGTPNRDLGGGWWVVPS